MMTCVRGTFRSAGSASRPWSSPVSITGPAPMLCPERSRSGGYSKRFFCVPIGLYRAAGGRKRPSGCPRDRPWAAPAGDNPAAVIRASTSPLLAPPDLHNQKSIRRQKTRRLRNQRAVGVEPVGAAVERGAGIVRRAPRLSRPSMSAERYRADLDTIRSNGPVSPPAIIALDPMSRAPASPSSAALRRRGLQRLR